MYLKAVTLFVLLATTQSQVIGRYYLDTLLGMIFGPANGNANVAGVMPPKTDKMPPKADEASGGDVGTTTTTLSTVGVDKKAPKDDLDSIIESIFDDTNDEDDQDVGTTKSPTAGSSSTLVPRPSLEEKEQPCMTKDNKPGVCVNYLQCNKDDTINTDGSSLITLRAYLNPCTYTDRCCSFANRKDDSVTTPPPMEKKREGCGWSNPDGVGGSNLTNIEGAAQFGEYPWTVAILEFKPVEGDQLFGQEIISYLGVGSLIHRKVVLTVAHRVASASKSLRARVGEWDTQKTNEVYPHQDRDVEVVAIHKNFNGDNSHYNIALLFLKSPVDPAPNTGIACLPPPKQVQKEGTRCFASGWGKDTSGKEGRYQSILKKVEVPVVKQSECQKAMRRTRLGRYFELHHSFMCAGGEVGKDTCKGDGGSPLVCPMENQPERFVQAGILAWGIDCGDDGIPGVYVDVAYLRDWIDEQMTAKGYGNEKVYADY